MRELSHSFIFLACCSHSHSFPTSFLSHHRGGTSPYFLSPSLARALRVEPEQAKACEKHQWAGLEPLSFENWNLKAQAYFELFSKSGLSSLIYCKPQIRPGPLSRSPGLFYLYLNETFKVLNIFFRSCFSSQQPLFGPKVFISISLETFSSEKVLFLNLIKPNLTILRWLKVRVLGLGLVEKADTRSRLEVGETNRSSLVVKTKPSS